MELKLFKTLWGHHGPYASAADLALAAGFHGLEGPLPTDAEKRREFLEAIQSRSLFYIAEISTTGFAVPDPGSTVAQHLEAFERILANSLEALPLFFSSMAGNDLWSFRESVEFFTKAWEIAQCYGVRVGFETHRSRSLFHPIVTRNLLAELPPIELTIDFSHWCTVWKSSPSAPSASCTSSRALATIRGPRFPIRAPRCTRPQFRRISIGGRCSGQGNKGVALAR
jgi:sugar phosphate isomerase/epimerase